METQEIDQKKDSEKNPIKNSRKNYWPFAIIVLAFLCCVSLIFYFNPHVVRTVLGDLNLIPIPEKLTELYFENAAALPKQTIAGQPMIFSFSIHNIEGEEKIYPYRVYFQYLNGDTIEFASSSVLLEDGASTTIPVVHIFKSSKVIGKVVVDLPTKDQHIDFLLHENI